MSIFSIFKKKKRIVPEGERLGALLVGLASFFVYLLTLPRVPSFEDSAEFVTAVATLGVPHPSGYPLYVLLAHPFTWLPIGTVTWRVSLFSAVLASLTLVMAYLLARRLLASLKVKDSLVVRVACGAIVLTVGFSELWWSQSVYAKVYVLHAFLVTLTVFEIVLAKERDQCRWLVMAAGTMGLALSNHLSLAAAHLPFLFLVAWMARPAFFRPSNWRVWLAALGVFLLGLLPAHVWMAWRAFGDPPYMMGEVNNWADFVNYLLRASYQDAGDMSLARIGLAADLLAKPFVQAGALVSVAFLAGIWRMTDGQRGKSAWVALAGVFAVMLSVPIALMARQQEATMVGYYISRVYGLAAYPMLATVAAVGAGWLFSVLARAEGRHWPDRWAAGLLLLLPVGALLLNWSSVSAYRHPFPYDHAKATLASLDPEAVLVVSDGLFTHDSKLFNMAYLQLVEGFRTDVTVLEDSGIVSMDRPEIDPTGYGPHLTLEERRSRMLHGAISDPRFAGRPLYATFPAESVSDYLVSMSNGLAFAVSRPGEVPPDHGPAPEVSLPPKWMMDEQLALSQQASNLMYAQAAYYLDSYGLKKSAWAIDRALWLDAAFMSHDYLGYQAYRQVRIDHGNVLP